MAALAAAAKLDFTSDFSLLCTEQFPCLAFSGEQIARGKQLAIARPSLLCTACDDVYNPAGTSPALSDLPSAQWEEGRPIF